LQPDFPKIRQILSLFFAKTILPFSGNFLKKEKIPVAKNDIFC